MKKLISSFLLLIVVPSLMFAQGLNEGFEDWHYDNDGAEVPVGWTNSEYGLLGKIESPHSGTYALVIWNWYCSTLGSIVNSQSSTPNSDLKHAGAPIGFLPTKLIGYYKYELEQGPFNQYTVDSAAVYVLLKRYNASTNDIDTISFAKQLLPSAAEWTSFSINLPLNIVGLQPDSVVIVFYTGNPESNAFNSVCSFLSLDDIALSTTSSVPYGANRSAPSARIIPNPLHHSAKIEFNGEEGKAYQVRLFDAGAKEVYVADFTGTTHDINELNLSSGVYYFSITDQENQPQATGQFVVE